VATDPGDYGIVLADLAAGGNIRPETRRELAEKAFAVTAAYDTNITQYLLQLDEKVLPPALHVALPQVQTLRYGENPHQQAALYGPPGIGPLGGDLLQGKPLSYNNLLDIDAAYGAAADFDFDAYGPTLVIVKHLTPTGIAAAGSLAEAFEAALASDPVSAFGGVIAANITFDGATAEALGDLFVEAIAAPEFSEEALSVLASRKNCRLLQMKRLPQPGFLLRSVRGGLLAQTPDTGADENWQVVTERQPTEAEAAALRFAWKAVAHVKSNAIVLGKGTATVGIGGGLPSRVDAVKLAAQKAGEAAGGSVLASDAFFPFPDGPEAAAEAGVTAIIQPGGSVRDETVIDACNQLGLAMVFTGVRHFRH
jgi:phosphoribosylaminoimidazolecarboxamide formyltransferase/IMP cyclohydrolase